LSMKPDWPIFFITNAFIAAVPPRCSFPPWVPVGYQHYSVGVAGTGGG
jgi:hypothetical protein